MPFQRAVKEEAKLRLAITGPSGSGKTYTALRVASHLAKSRIALVDTEHGSASKYADVFSFDVLNLKPPYHPDRFVEALQEAAAADYDVVIIDSLSHAWNGTGGMLEIVDEIAKRKTGGNTFAAWKDGAVIQSRLVDSIVSAPIHVIATLRSKQEYAQERDERGKTVVRKIGMQAQQREGVEYEFDVVMDMNIDHEGIVSKTRCSALTDKVIARPGKEVADILLNWLSGEAPAVVAQPQSFHNTSPMWADPRDAIQWAEVQGLTTGEARDLLTRCRDACGGKLNTQTAADVYAMFKDEVEATLEIQPA